VNGGFLVITGTIPGSAAAPVAVNNGGTLLGTNGVTGAGQISGNLNVNLGGTLTMGDGTATNPTGILTVTGPVAMVSGANFTLVMNGNTPGIGTASHDQLNLTGGGSIAIGNSTLNTALGYTPGGTDTITFITGGAVGGIFSGKPDNSTFFVGAFGGQNYAATIHYTATSVFLNTFTPVPEPLHILALGGLAAGGFGWWKRRKK